MNTTEKQRQIDEIPPSEIGQKIADAFKEAFCQYVDVEMKLIFDALGIAWREESKTDEPT